MRATTRSSFIRIFLLTLLYGGIGFYIKHSPFENYYLQGFPLLLVIFASIYFSFSAMLLAAKDLSPGKFINRFILLTGIKLLALFVVILLWLILEKENPVIFLGYVLALYLGFSISSYYSVLSGKN